MQMGDWKSFINQWSGMGYIGTNWKNAPTVLAGKYPHKKNHQRLCCKRTLKRLRSSQSTSSRMWLNQPHKHFVEFCPRRHGLQSTTGVAFKIWGILKKLRTSYEISLTVVVKRQAEEVGKLAPEKSRAQENHKHKTRTRLKNRARKQKERRQSNKTMVKLKLSSQASE